MKTSLITKTIIAILLTTPCLPGYSFDSDEDYEESISVSPDHQERVTDPNPRAGKKQRLERASDKKAQVIAPITLNDNPETTAVKKRKIEVASEIQLQPVEVNSAPVPYLGATEKSVALLKLFPSDLLLKIFDNLSLWDFYRGVSGACKDWYLATLKFNLDNQGLERLLNLESAITEQLVQHLLRDRNCFTKLRGFFFSYFDRPASERMYKRDNSTLGDHGEVTDKKRKFGGRMQRPGSYVNFLLTQAVTNLE
jgi:hypothetical protein